MPTNPPKTPAKRPAAPAQKPQEPHHTSWWTDRRISLFALGVGVLMGGFGTVVTTSLYQSRDNNAVLDIIKDSVDPGGRRFQEGQSRTAAAVGTINEISVYAAYCASRHAELPAIEGCVRAEYARAHPPTTTTTSVP